MSSINPFPWHRPKEDARARSVEPLVSPGLSHAPPAAERLPGAGVLAILAGVGFPLAGLVYLLVLGLPPVVTAVLAAAGLAWLLVGVRAGLAAKRRARARAAEHARRHPPTAPAAS